jgi:hypothetical protein
MGNLVFQATLGGQVNLVGPNTASTFNLNVPATSSTIATLTGTETFTNKTLTSPTLTTPVLGTPSSGTLTNCTGLPNTGLVNSSVTIGGTAIALGASSSTITNDLSISGLTVGKGYGTLAYNTALGITALGSSSLTGNYNTAVGYLAGSSNTSGVQNAFFGRSSGQGNTTGQFNTFLGDFSAGNNTTGSYNTTLGQAALNSNTTGSNNTALGYQALYTTAGGTNKLTAVGYQAGYSNSSGQESVFVGETAGYSTTGGDNTFIGRGAGTSVTSGYANTIIGKYSGNQGGLDIRTSNNYIVLSDGSGNPYVYGYNGYLALNANSGSRYSQFAFNNASVEKATMFWDNTLTNLYVRGASGGVYLTNTGTSWTSNSDERLKENLVPITNALTKVNTLRAVIGNFISDETKKKTPFLIAQDVQAVLPEAISTTMVKDDETNTQYLGVAYTEVIPLLVASIKELKTIVDTQAAEIAELKAKVA